MSRLRGILVLVGGLVACGLSGTLAAQEKKHAVDRSGVPSACRETKRWSAAEAFQAAAGDERFLFAIDSARIVKYDRASGERLAESQGPAQHLNSGFWHEGKLLCAHSNYPAMPEQSEIKVLDPASMRLSTFHTFGDVGGSLTWVLRHDGAWWCNFARYGTQNANTFLARFDDQWRETARWTYPEAVVRHWGAFSASGGIWRGGLLMVTGHDERELYCLRLPQQGQVLEHISTVPAPFAGQGICIDPFTSGILGIDRAKRQIVLGQLATGAATERRPNIVFIVADDLGYGDLGCYGQKKIRTPNLDQLAAEGMRFTQHYSGNAVCAPSRCVLMTGKHPGHAFIRDNREVQPEGQYPLPAATKTLPRLLQEHGYVTGAFGKWGLGAPDSSGTPLQQGFHRFFGYNCQRQAHNYFPTYLWDNDRRRPLDNPAFAAHQKLPTDADPNDARSYAKFVGREFAPDLIAGESLRFVREHSSQPFFLFMPTTVPHLALQVPEDSLKEYQNSFDEEPYVGGRGYLPHRTPRAAYAAMITRLDREIGRVMRLVHELGLDARTLFVFSSDNGPLYDRLGGTDTEFFNSAAGLRGRKGSLYEGGIRVPLIVRWSGVVRPGVVNERVTGFEDWLPTLLELSGATARIPADVDGVSFAATLRGAAQAARPFLYREFPGYSGQQSVRVGDWKAVRQRLRPAAAKKSSEGAGRLELYDLRGDPREERDVAADHPEVVQKLAVIMREQHATSPEFPIPALDEVAVDTP